MSKRREITLIQYFMIKDELVGKYGNLLRVPRHKLNELLNCKVVSMDSLWQQLTIPYCNMGVKDEYQ